MNSDLSFQMGMSYLFYAISELCGIGPREKLVTVDPNNI